MKKYVYFIVYDYTGPFHGGIGNCDHTLDREITEISQIREIEKEIEGKKEIKVIITDYKLLRVEEIK